ncbi:MAG TPA: hypothetical protein P5560_10720 [Thermotogota bacterium]|nr:hypothetical protein [Thermotogota bacterium]HRW93410.1 hypothetical protein [Thermotogota bacterium]
MQIQRVESHRQLRQFIALPYAMYRNDPNWVAPLRSEQRKLYDPRKNLMLPHCEYALFLLLEGKNVLGRIAAFFDHDAVEYWGEAVGFFGAYECIDDPTASHLLLSTAKHWLQNKGMQKMRGPWSFSSQEWGMVVEGFSPPPVVLAPYNAAYYPAQMEAFGLQKVKDLLVFLGDPGHGYRIPERFVSFSEVVSKRYGITIRTLDRKKLERDVKLLVGLTNQSIARNWGYYPVSEAEANAIANDLRRIVDPELIFIAQDAQGEAVGFAMTLPDINQALTGLDGRLFPLGWLRLLAGMKKINQYRMWGLGVVPRYQGKAIDILLYLATYEVMKKRKARLEINYVLEDNHRMQNALQRLQVQQLRRYRVYQAEL